MSSSEFVDWFVIDPPMMTTFRPPVIVSDDACRIPPTLDQDCAPSVT